MQIRRIGNWGIINTGTPQGLFTFSIGKGWQPASVQLSATSAYWPGKQSVAGTYIVPMGADNNLPARVRDLLDNFYAGEGLLGKITGLQWGDGPRLYREAVDADSNKFFRQWCVEPEVTAEMEHWNYREMLLRCLVDLTHMGGFYVKFVRTRGARLGMKPRFAKLEHIPFQNVRLVWPKRECDEPSEVLVADFPNPDPRYIFRYPLFDPADPFRHPVSVAYYRLYSFGKKWISTPRFYGALEWLELAGGLATILKAYNENASAISLHIESPQSYWDAAEQRIKDICHARGVRYTAKMLDDFKDTAMEQFAGTLTGKENAGKYFHTSQFWNAEANSFEGWHVTPVDKKIRDYVEAQVKISNKADAAATSGFGLDPVLSNLILENKLSSGSEKLYSLKVYNASETAIPDMVLCQPLQHYLAANFPGMPELKVGLYRPVVETESNVSPADRLAANT